MRYLSCMANELLESDTLHLFLLSDVTQINGNQYLESIETATELIVCTEEQMHKLCIHFGINRYLQFKNISY